MDAFLLTLNTRKAFLLFLLALLIAGIAIVANVGLPWAPASIVLAYGIVLFYAERHLLVSLSDLTSNSPYFLGFVLFLLSLFVTFRRLIESDTTSDGFIIRQLGGALLTTIVGLPLRQLLFAYAPAAKQQEDFYRNLEEELRRSAGEFKKSQAELTAGIRDFVTLREEIFLHEQKAAKKYVASLEKAIGIFDDVFSDYPTRISSALDSSAQVIADLRVRADAVAKSLASIQEVDTKALAQLTAGLRGSLVELNEELAVLNKSIAGTAETSKSLPQQLSMATTSISTAATALENRMRENLEDISRDMRGIDQVLTDFTELMQQKLSAV